MKYQERFLTIWDAPAKPAVSAKKSEKTDVSLLKSLVLLVPSLKR